MRLLFWRLLYYYEIEIDRGLSKIMAIVQFCNTLSTGADAGFKCHISGHRYVLFSLSFFLNNQLIFFAQK